MKSEIRAAMAAAAASGVSDVAELTDWIYAHCYIRQFGVEAAAIGEEDLTARLQQANGSRNTTDHGWRAVELLGNGDIAASKRGTVRRFAAGSYLSAERGPGTPPAKGDAVSVYVRKESLLTQEGNYFVFSETVGAEPEWSGSYRFYWNIAAEGAAALVEAVTAECNVLQLSFRFKCPRQAASYFRRDGAVLYMPREQAHMGLVAVERIRRRVAEWLRGGEGSTPMFTRRLADGLGFAESPAGPGSFGMQRCRRLAEAVLGGEDVEVLGERPWLNAGPEDIEWPPAEAAAGARCARGSLLETAARIGARLCRDAIWHGGICNWTADEEVGGRVVHQALAANVYRGAAGVALFLSRLSGATGEGLLRRTAEGAMRYAVSGGRRDVPSGLYSGRPGVLLAAAEVLGNVEEREMLAACRPHEAHTDVTAGCAGAIAALLSMRRRFGGSEALLGQAVENGDWLREKGDGLHRLTGFSHGAAGYAWVFAELYAASGERRFADAAYEAIGYERKHFDAGRENWPDFRQNPARFFSMWCHGAGGIGLSRLRVAEILRRVPEHDGSIGDGFVEECEAAWKALEETRFPNWCLCHGMAGNADILLEAGRREWAMEQARAGQEQFEYTGVPWPCDSVPQGETPGLMTGVAGIGYFYLRMAREETPSILLWR
ncbi:MAG: hypothetical protein JNK48_05530 [Bryobacterales bacterium]|nr:hypothetical protein [Bryobacterales bacterium]